VQKFWISEADQEKKSKRKTLNILEFGCGSGRLLDQLLMLKGFKINYT